MRFATPTMARNAGSLAEASARKAQEKSGDKRKHLPGCLPDETVALIKRDRLAMTRRAVASKYGISERRVYDIDFEITYANVKPA